MSSISRIKAIFIKETQDIKTNSNVILMFIIPILLTLIYKYMIQGMPEGLAVTFGLLFLAVMIGMYVPSMIIAEEKEKKTLQVLLLSPAKPVEVFIGKGLLTFISIIVFGILLVAIEGNMWDKLPVVLLALILVSIPCIFIGMIVGMLAQNQMATGGIGFPIYMLFLMLPLLTVVNEGNFLARIASVLPTFHFTQILYKVFFSEYTFENLYIHFLAIIASCIVIFGLLYVVYRKKGSASIVGVGLK